MKQIKKYFAGMIIVGAIFVAPSVSAETACGVEECLTTAEKKTNAKDRKNKIPRHYWVAKSVAEIATNFIDAGQEANTEGEDASTPPDYSDYLQWGYYVIHIAGTVRQECSMKLDKKLIAKLALRTSLNPPLSIGLLVGECAVKVAHKEKWLIIPISLDVLG